MSAARRLFVGLPLSGAEKAALAALQSGLPGARWTPPDNFHITLCFLGVIAGEQVDAIDARLGALSFKPFQRQCRSVGCWNDSIVWTGIDAGEAIQALKSAIDASLAFFQF
jgi:RNA 2',3'-cyclic 3'-phosphodiesterase